MASGLQQPYLDEHIFGHPFLPSLSPSSQLFGLKEVIFISTYLR
jgi:hypothetical protein